MCKSSGKLISTVLITTVIIFMFLTPVLAFPEDTPNEDVTDSIDHPLISRFPGSYIRFYESKDYDEGFGRKLYEGIDFKDASETHFEGLDADKESGRYLAAKLNRAEGDVYISLFTAKHGFYGGSWPDGQPAVFQVIVEETDLETDLINVESVMQDINSKGKAAIYGIQFDVDSAEIKEKSETTINKIAELLNENPDLNLNVVGHTDSTGDLEYNIDLSERRAESLVEVLVNDYNIDENRLNPFGVGPLAPKATNETENGRAKNRRVELVKK